MELPIMNIDFPPKREAYQQVFDEIIEKIFIDEMLECINFEIILSVIRIDEFLIMILFVGIG